MIGLIPAVLLFLTAVSVVGVRWLRPSFTALWFLLATGSLLAWLSLPVLRFFVPIAENRVYWNAVSIFDNRLAFSWDGVSWAGSFVLLTLLVGGLLADVVEDARPGWFARSQSMVLCGLGLVAALAANLYTFFLALTALDLILLVLDHALEREPQRLRRSTLGFGGRMIGSGLLLLAAVFAETGAALPFNSASLSGWLIFFGGVARLGLLPEDWAFYEDEIRDRQFGRFSQFTVFITGLLLILRTFSTTGLGTAVSGELAIVPLVVLATLSLTAAVAWLSLRAPGLDLNALLGGAAGLVMATELRALPSAGLVLGMSWLLTAGLLASLTMAGRLATVLALFGFWTVSMLPYSATWDGSSLFVPPFHPVLILFVVVQGILLAGSFWRLFRVDGERQDTERWIRVLYPVVLLVHPAAALLIAWSPWQGLGWIGANPWWPGFVATALSVLVWWRFSEREVGLDPALLRRGLQVVAEIARLVFTVIGRGFERGAKAFTAVLEGEGGVLWALLVMTLLLSILTQLGNGGS